VLSRRRMLSLMSLLAASAAVGGCAASAPSGRSAAALRGADLSFTLEEEAAGATFRDGARAAPVEQLLADRGANVVRLRVWVDAAAGHSDLASALALARRARGAGMQVLLDLHYSDTWADKANQRTPASWAGRDLQAMAETVRSYTRDCLEAFAAQKHPDRPDPDRQRGHLGHAVARRADLPGRPRALGGVRHAPASRAARGEGERVGRSAHRSPHRPRWGQRGSRYFFDHVVGADVDFDVHRAPPTTPSGTGRWRRCRRT